MPTTLSIRLDPDLDHRLEAESRRSDTTRSELVRDAIADYLRRRERGRFLAEVVDEARRLKEEPEAAELAEEGLALDNEAMQVAEKDSPTPERVSKDLPWWR